MERGVLEVQIQKRFAGGGSPRGPAALDVAFEAAAGFTIVFGASGAGKTRLLNCIAGSEQPDTGSISVGGTVVLDTARRIHLTPDRRGVGYVFQDLALFPHLSAEHNVAYGLAKLDQRERKARIEAILSSFRIEHLRNRKPAGISGGERQRVALARVLVTDPRVLLLDEPLAGLDGPTKSKILEDLRAWNEEHRVPILYVTHSHDEVFALGERVLVLEAGRLVAQGTPHEVMSAPRLEAVAQLAGFENIFDVVVDAEHEERGTMTCRVVSSGNSPLTLETPLVGAEVGRSLRVGIRAGDILLATREPSEISARNVFPGTVAAVERRDVVIVARVRVACDPAVELSVQLTLAARDSLRLVEGREVWLVIKTHSCHLMAERA